MPNPNPEIYNYCERRNYYPPIRVCQMHIEYGLKVCKHCAANRQPLKEPKPPKEIRDAQGRLFA